MKMDRTYQHAALTALRDAYPSHMSPDDLPDHPDRIANLWYLWQHELIDASDATCIGMPPDLDGVRITARGIDFLEDDGGTSAILRTVTIRLDADALRALIDARVQSSDLPDAQKSVLRHAIRSLPGQALQA